VEDLEPMGKDTRKDAFLFVVLFGVVSLFADMTYEGARSITGPFLGTLGVNAKTVGFVAGLGEFLGYALRLVSGALSDRTKRYWFFTGLGYTLNLLAVPLLALAGAWEVAAILMILERVGKAIRNPARDAMLSHATHQMGRGLGFGIHEALDQIGAVSGPLVVAAVFSLGYAYRAAFASLAIPAIIALSIVAYTRFRYPRPQTFEARKEALPEGGLKGGWKALGFPRTYWIYLAAASLLAAGFIDFPLLAFHFTKTGKIEPSLVALLYALAMGVDALAALAFGKWYDKKGLSVLAISTVISFLFAVPAFLFGGSGTGTGVWGSWGAIAGVVLWGIGMGAQESIMRAAVADLIPSNQRATAYGVFNTFYGVSWFAGSAVFGLLYDRFLPAGVVFSLVLQGAAIPLFLYIGKLKKASDRSGAEKV